MGRQWCHTSDPVVIVDGKPCHLKVSIAATAQEIKDNVEMFSVTAVLPGEVRVPPGQEGHRMFGRPFGMTVAAAGGMDPSLTLEIAGGDDLGAEVLITMELTDGRVLVGSGTSDEVIEADVADAH